MNGLLDNFELEGVIPRIIKQIFKHIQNTSEEIEFTVKVSMIEIYMEKVKDLIDASRSNLSIREDKSKGIYNTNKLRNSAKIRSPQTTSQTQRDQEINLENLREENVKIKINLNKHIKDNLILSSEMQKMEKENKKNEKILEEINSGEPKMTQEIKIRLQKVDQLTIN